jgi:CheY-like chemotaxis protein
VNADRRLNLLLVEDDELDAMNVQRAFTAGQLRSLTVAQDGMEALKLLEAGQLAPERLIVMLDLQMPRMNGLELLREIRRRPALRHLPMVVFTTSDDENDRRAAFALQAAGYMTKPVEFSEFRQKMDSFYDYWSSVEFPAQ